MSAPWSRRPIRCRPPGSSTGWLATSIERSLRRVVTPVHQRVPPGRVTDVSRGLLRQVPVHVAHHLVHVSGVVLGQIAFLARRIFTMRLPDWWPVDSPPDPLSPTDFDSSVPRKSSSSLAVMLTASCQSAQTWAKVSSAPVAIALPFFLSADGLARG